MDLVLSPQVMIEAASTRFDEDLHVTDERHLDQILPLPTGLAFLVSRSR